MLLLPLVVVATMKPAWDLAVCAQFYYPVGDKRHSRRHYYLLSLDGKRRVQISRQPLTVHDQIFVRWRDRRHVVWLETVRGRHSLLELDVPTWKKRTVAEWPVAAVEYNWSTEFPAKIRTWLGHLLDDPKWSEFTLSRGGRVQTLTRGKEIYPVRNGFEKWKVSCDLEPKTEISVADIDPHLGFVSEARVGGQELLSVEQSWGHVGLKNLFRVDLKKKEAWVLPADLERISVRPKRDLWAGVSGRNLGQETEPDVWTSSLSIGRIKEGKPRVILRGRLSVLDVSLRP